VLSAPARHEPTPRGVAAAVLALTALAAVLRILAAQDSLWADELFLYEIVNGHGLGDALSIVRETESTPPLYFVVAWASAQLGDDMTWIRVPSVLVSTATVPLLYALGSRTVGRAAALVGAALFALAPFDLFYGSEARGYSAVVFLCAASTLSLLELVRSGRRRWVVALALTVAGAAYTHYTVAFVLLVQLGWALWRHRERTRPVLAAYGAAALLYVPWIPGALDQLRDNTSERVAGLSGLRDVSEGIAGLWIGHPFAPLGVIPGRAAVIVIGLGLLLAAAFALRDRARPSPATLLLVALTVATPLAALAYELGSNSILQPRYLSPSVPYGALVGGALLAAPRPRLVAALASLAVLGGVAVGTVRTLEPGGGRPDYRAAARELDRIAAPEAPVVELGIFTGPPGRELSYNFERPHEYFAVGEDVEPALELARENGRLYLVVPETALGGFLALLDLEQQGFRLVDRRDWPGFVGLVLLAYEPG
jgi:4-amino-4-deoxy-L-arabinose transferase-like glycosyltransferase